MTAISIRRVNPDDLPTLLEIYNHYVRETAITFDVEPRTLVQRRAWLNGFSLTGRYQCFVANKDGRVVGWASSHPYNERAAYETTVMTSIYLAPDARGRGLGRQLYSYLLEVLDKEDIHRIYGGITLPNEASVGLHTRMGFELVGIFQEVGRKFGRYWDVAAYIRRVKQG